MKGKLHKTEVGWIVKYFDTRKAHDIMYCGESLPLHPDDDILVFSGMHGMEIEFKIVNIYNVLPWVENKNTLPYDDNVLLGNYAKLINHIDTNEVISEKISDEELILPNVIISGPQYIPEISDEEIEKASKNYYDNTLSGNGQKGFVDGIKWYKEKLKSK